LPRLSNFVGVAVEKKAIALNAVPAWPGIKDDFILRYEGHEIGRIRRLAGVWEWAITIPMAMPTWAQGSTDNLEDCKKAFATAWGRIMSTTNPERLNRAWELERAVEARRQRIDATSQGGKIEPGSGDR
jgi:hypothetical protein